jgi:hypothetical protein
VVFKTLKADRWYLTAAIATIAGPVLLMSALRPIVMGQSQVHDIVYLLYGFSPLIAVVITILLSTYFLFLLSCSVEKTIVIHGNSPHPKHSQKIWRIVREVSLPASDARLFLKERSPPYLPV